MYNLAFWRAAAERRYAFTLRSWHVFETTSCADCWDEAMHMATLTMRR